MFLCAFLFSANAFCRVALRDTFVNNRVYSPCLALNCICINCSRVMNCQAYNFVETKHEQPHMNENPTFKPRDGNPKINVHIRNSRSGDSRDFGPTNSVIDMDGIVSTEYDVVACDDYQEDIGMNFLYLSY